MAKMDISKKRVITPEFRVSFPNVFTAKAFRNQEPKYSITMLFDKDADIKLLKQAAHNAMIEKFGSKYNFPKKWKSPFRDGDEKEDVDGYEGKIFVTASTKNRPGLIGPDKQAILNSEDFYSGCYARAELIAFWYEVEGSKGVSFALMNLQKTKDGQAFSGRKKAEDVFDEVESSDDDSDDYADDDYADDDLGF